MRIASGVVDQVIYFVAVDSTDFATRETGLTTFTVYRSRNGGAAAAMTTPTVTEVDATNMQGVYKLLLDEDMTLTTGNLTEEMVYHITQADMAPVTRTIELYQQSNTDYTDGRVWVDSTAANTNTVYGVDGTAVNPVSTDAAAISVGSAFIGIWNRYNYATGSTSTLSSGYTNHEWYGQNYDLNLNGQALDDCYFEGATITGVATCTNGMKFEKCKMDTCTLDLATIKNSIFVSDATITLTTKVSPENAQPEYTFFACGADHYNANVPTIAMPAGACFLNILDWHGPIQFTGLIAGQVIHLSGTFDDIDLNAPASAATVVISGSYRSIIAEGSASIDIVGAIIPSIVQDNQTDANTLITNVAAVQTQVDKIPASDGTSGWNATALAAINTEVDNSMVTYGLDHLVSAAVVGADVTDNSIIAYLASKSATADWDSFDNTSDALEAIADAGATDPWGVALPGAYGAGTAGEILGDWKNGGRLDLILDIIAADTTTDIPALIATLQADLDEITDAAGDGVVVGAVGQVAIADAMLNRDMSTGTDSGSASVRTPRQALRFLRNKWSISGTDLTVTKEDDSTESWAAVITPDATADPITGSDPAS